MAAVDAVQRVAGVRTVADELRLPDPGSEPHDHRLAAAVDATLEWTAGVPHEGIHADVEGHDVVLTGEVDTRRPQASAPGSPGSTHGSPQSQAVTPRRPCRRGHGLHPRSRSGNGARTGVVSSRSDSHVRTAVDSLRAEGYIDRSPVVGS
ncbi:BON domain-containing protein [Leifsonia sp. P73]|uniref:BON domain-containing protein n=1 Tax=Leifsonia sp. P73 TaxID=3423959 RepID=UPI003DA6C134